ncbi:MAG: Spy0128 family protein [Erysipelotrichaceae bacterium]
MSQIPMANTAFVYEFLGQSGTGGLWIGNQYTETMIIDGQEAYCVDMITPVEKNHMYSRTSLQASTYYSQEQANRIRAMLANSYPTKTVANLASASGIKSLTAKQAVAATQLAIWTLSNASDTLPNTGNLEGDNATNVKKMVSYLLALAPAGAYQTQPIELVFDTKQEQGNVIFDYGRSINVASLQNHNIVVTKDGVVVPHTSSGTKVIVDASGVTTKATYAITLKGTQQLAADVYFYNPEGGRQASQALISYFAGVSQVQQSTSMVFDPTLEQIHVGLEAKKAYNRPLVGDDFVFALYETNAQSSTLKERVTNNKQGDIVFSNLVFNQSQLNQVFTYQIKEEVGQLGGVTYDTLVYDIRVELVSQDGSLQARVSYHLDGSNIDQVVFTNTYQAQATSLVLDAKKVLEEKAFGANTFQFELRDSNNNVLERVGNQVDGTIVFSPLHYKLVGRYTYTMQEVIPEEKELGMSYDIRVYNVTVEVSDNLQGQLVATPTYQIENQVTDEIVFVNQYKPLATTASLEASKVLLGRSLDDEMFAFTLSNKYKDLETVWNQGAAIRFAPLTFDKVGNYHYFIREEYGELPAIQYDEQVYAVIVNVVDVAGQLQASIHYPDETGIVFTNTYTPTPIRETITLDKVLVGKDLKTGQFTFILTSEDGEIQRVSNAADGTIVFEGIEVSAAGTYHFTIKEELDNQPGIIYDTKEVKVRIDVVDDGLGNLSSVVSYDSDANFENRVIQGKLALYKVDAANGRLLEGAKFDVIDEFGNIVDTLITDVDGQAISKKLNYGTYHVVETQAPLGYIKNPTPVPFEIVKEGVEVVLVLRNNDERMGMQGIVFTKRMETSARSDHDDAYLAVRFGVFVNESMEMLNANYELVRYEPGDLLVELEIDADGQLIVEHLAMIPGSYYLQETKTHGDYVLDQTQYPFEVSRAEPVAVVSTEEVFNLLERNNLIINKMDQETNLPLANAVFQLYDQDMKAVEGFEVTTDKEGVAIFSKLANGTYYVVETSAPDGYVKDTKANPVVLKDVDQTLVLTNVKVVETGVKQPLVLYFGWMLFGLIGLGMLVKNKSRSNKRMK